MEDIQKQILDLTNSIKRPGIDKLIDFLVTSDFFKAPCSTRFHLACPGGLAKHSLNVYNLLAEKAKRYGLDVEADTLKICGLFHDLCKVNFYKEGGEQASQKQKDYLRSLSGKSYETISKGYASTLINHLKNGGSKEELPSPEIEYAVEDQLPLGHGEKSVMVLQDYIKLLDIEKLAIRWHMLAFDAGIHFDYPSGFAFREASKNPLVVLLFTSDYESSQILEEEKENAG